MSPEPDLASLRAEIDRIDDRILDLLVERFAVVARIASAKAVSERPGLALRPAREAAILRRLAVRAHGRVPLDTLVRTWRELLAASIRLQTPLSLAVWAPAGREWVWDLARDQFGSVTPAERAADPQRALAKVVAGEAQIAVLPLPEAQEDWWSALLAPPAEKLSAIARLPFLAQGTCFEALAFAALASEPSGDDRTLLVLETKSTSRAGLLAALNQAGLAPRALASLEDEDRTRHLIEIAGHRVRGEVPLEIFPPLVRAQLRCAVVLGAYPRPLSAKDEQERASFPLALASE